MAQSARSTDHEYWRPPNPTIVRLQPPVPVSCPRCSTELLTGAFFCHVCGTAREKNLLPVSSQTTSVISYLDIGILRRRLGLSVPSLLFFLLGVACMLFAALLGFIFRMDTLLDWQAVQLWRIEWLLGAAAALLAGVLLKRTRSKP